MCNRKCKKPKSTFEQWHHQRREEIWPFALTSAPALKWWSDSLQFLLFLTPWKCLGLQTSLILQTFLVARLKLLLAIHPNAPMHIPPYKMVKKPYWKALSTFESGLLWVEQVLAPVSRLSPCHLTVQVIHLHWKQKANESKETPIDLIGWFWKLHFRKQTSQLVTDHLDNILELTWPSRWAEASFHWWDHD